jgi:membrane protease YdiL (CAAX protease family)
MAQTSTPSKPPSRTLIAWELAQEYWVASRQPLVSLVFIGPLLAVYEIGVWTMGPHAVRNGADLWMRQFLKWIELDHYFLLPALTVGILLGWHHVARQPWRFSRGVLSLMVVECALLAVCLRVLVPVEEWMLREIGRGLGMTAPPPTLRMADVSSHVGEMLGFLGAGIYEELLFRLMLLSAAVWAARRWGAGRASVPAAVLATSLVFAAAHYLPPHGEAVRLAQFTFWLGFVFRVMAGAFFGLLFRLRGFGIAAGAHAGYDILANLT